jgi:hypothetical protein
MPKSDEFILNRLRWKARKYNLPTENSIFFNDLSSSVQAYLNSLRNITASGIPGLFFTKPTKEWTLVCTKQIICYDNNNIISINLSDIDKISSTVFDPAIKIPWSELSKMKTKSEWDTIKVTTNNGFFYVLHANKGSDLFALWNILLMMARLDQ